MKKFLFIIFTCLYINKSFSITITVSSNADSGLNTLRAALGAVSPSDTIEFNLSAGSTTISLASALPFVDFPLSTDTLTIDGTNAGGRVTILGSETPAVPGFVIKKGTVTISNLNIDGCVSQGGSGGTGDIDAGGGGGMGAGGGIFINHTASVVLSDINFGVTTGCQAKGGNGGDGVFKPAGFSGGGGAGGLGGTGAPNDNSGGGGGGGFYSNASGQTAGTGGGNGGTNAGAQAGFNATEFGGGGGSSGAIPAPNGSGGKGSFGGGGGGSLNAPGGDGFNGANGFGGGGGGGGGAGGGNEVGGTGATGGGDGGTADGSSLTGAGGGGGAGFGGALFLRNSGGVSGELSLNADITSNQSTSPGAAGSGGLVSATGGSSAGAGAYLMSSTVLKLNPGSSDNKTIAAEIAGAGSVLKNASGTYNLTATNTYTGTTTISSGTLVVNGSIATSSATTVAAGATLKGTGTVSATTVNGIIAPGDSTIGTLTVAGNYTQATGSTLKVDIDSSGNASKVNITGSATIQNGAILEVTAQAGDYNTDLVYTVLEAASGRTGEFSTFTITNPAELDGGILEVSYSSNLVQLIFSAAGSEAVSNAFPSNNLLNQASHLQSNIAFDQSILRYYQYLCPCHKKTMRPYLSAEYLHGHYKAHTYTKAGPFSLSGALMGIDYWTDNNVVIGSFFNYIRSWSMPDDHSNKTRADNYILSVYIQKLWDKFFIEAAVNGLSSNFKTDRFLNRNKINEAAFDGYSLFAQTKAAGIFRFNNMSLITSVAVRYFYNRIETYKEKIEISDRLDLKAQKNRILEAMLTSHFSNVFFVSFGAIIPQIEISYIADVLRDKIIFNAKLFGSSTSRKIQLRPNPDNLVRLKTVLDFRFHNCSILNMSYAVSFATKQRMANEVQLGYRIDF